jgi:hypothetical protein
MRGEACGGRLKFAQQSDMRPRHLRDKETSANDSVRLYRSHELAHKAERVYRSLTAAR